VTHVDANGGKVPALSFGTFGLNSRDTLRMLPAALRAGFRHIDTAQVYGNKAEVSRIVSPFGLAPDWDTH
jgi:2,5-diketo-D-gluconate reductase B